VFRVGRAVWPAGVVDGSHSQPSFG
jgi:hypothetical protein